MNDVIYGRIKEEISDNNKKKGSGTIKLWGYFFFWSNIFYGKFFDEFFGLNDVN